MKNDRFLTLGYSLFYALALSFAPSLHAQDKPDEPAPPRRPPEERVRIESGDEDGPRERRREIRIERRGPDSDRGPRIEPFPGGGPGERRIFRRGPDSGEDVIIRRFAEPREPMAPPRGDLEGERARHLEQAIDHLHAAGMHEMADRLRQQLEKRRIEPPRPPQDLGRVHEEIAQLKKEQQALRKEFRKLEKALRKDAKDTEDRKESRKEKE